VHERTSSTGNLCGSKFQLSSEAIKRGRVSFGKSIGGLLNNQAQDHNSKVIRIRLNMVLVHGHQGVNIHIAQELRITEGTRISSSHHRPKI
jgi:hypothetical protein